EARLFKRGSIRSDFAHQSFSVSGEGSMMTMKPSTYVNPMSGKFVRKDLTFASLGTNCVECHGSGPRFSSEQLKLMDGNDYANMEGYSDFVNLMNFWGASKQQQKKTEAVMKQKGPTALLPLDDMIRANQERWIAIYPVYQQRRKVQVAR